MICDNSPTAWGRVGGGRQEKMRICVYPGNTNKTVHTVHTATKQTTSMYRVADKSLVRPARKEARNHVMDARDFNNIETRAVIKFFFLQGKAPKEIHAILTETLVFFPSWSG